MNTGSDDGTAAAAPAWESRCAALWARLDDITPADFVDGIDALTAELSHGNPIAAFERASARDSTGRTAEAVALYRAALAGGLEGLRRRRATIQLASSLRVMGHAEHALALLEAEAGRPVDELTAAVQAFRALALADLGREREALALSLTALAPLLPRYQRSLARYAQALLRTEGDA